MKPDAWFRVYTRILNNAKIQTMDAELFRQLVNFWGLTKLNDGVLPPIQEIAWMLRRSIEQVEDDIAKLVELDLFVRRGKNVAPKGWEDWQTKKPKSTERVRKYRETRGETLGETLDGTLDFGGGETHIETPAETPMERKNETQRRKEEKREEKNTGDFAAQNPAVCVPESGTSKRFVKPTAEQVSDYATSINFKLNGQHFVDFYETKGWKVGNSPMKNWQAAVRTWKQRRTEEAGKSAAPKYQRPEFPVE